MSERDRPVLVGGTGRSGSTIVGHLLDQHPGLTLTRPMEVRFIAGNDGLADALAAAGRNPKKGAAAAALAVERIRTRWYERAEHVGLHTSVAPAELQEWTNAYLQSFAADPLEATRTLARRIMGRVAEGCGADRWVDTTPANSRKADRVEPIYPDSLVVTVIRDGRDVAASFVQQTFGPDDVFEALDQWEERMARSHRAQLASRPGRVLVIELDDLVRRDREGTLGALCDHLGIEVDPGMRAWFDARMSPEHAHLGRWRQDFDGATAARIDERYAAIIERLRAQGVRVPA